MSTTDLTTEGLDKLDQPERLDQPVAAYDAETVRRLDREHVFHSWSAQGAIDPLPIAGAQGSRFWDYDGREYLDFSSQLVNANIGHGHPKVIAAIQGRLPGWRRWRRRSPTTPARTRPG